MKIGIDARFIGPQGTGLGKYTEKLILSLAKIDKKNQYFIFLKKNNWSYLKLPQNFTKVLADVNWYSVEEQIKMPSIFNAQNLDLLHVPHFNVPIFYRGKFIVTIHDLIHHQFDEESVTTKNKLKFKTKRIGYKLIIGSAVKKAQKIITPSTAVKNELIKTFNLDKNKVEVTYEAAEEEYQHLKPDHQKNNPFLIYVGNVYPHKNITSLLEAIKITPKINLKIICARDVFWERLNKEITIRQLEKKVTTLPYQKPQQLAKIFTKATAYVFPTLSEGFGIPPLNAMTASLPVICSSIPVLKEVYGDAAVYFNPKDPTDIAAKIEKVTSSTKFRESLIKKGHMQVAKYSWQKMAAQTLQIYYESI